MVDIKTHDLRRKKKPEDDDADAKKEEESVDQEPEKSADQKPEPEVKTAPKASEPPKRRRSPARAPKELAAAKDQQSSSPKPPTRRKPPVKPTSRTTSPRPTRARKTHPLVGITCAFENLPDKKVHSQQYFHLYRTYVTSIYEAGGVPVILPVGLEKRYGSKIIDSLDGLLVPGAVTDVDPGYYGDNPSHELRRVDPRQDRTEIELFNLAFLKNIPIFAICRGIQLMNVALDGSLYQDVTSQTRMSMNHEPRFPPSEPCHLVQIERGSKLHNILEVDDCPVNSTHHQAVKLNGKGLIVNARALDGIIEGIEHPSKKWVIGVQWHPELLWMKDKVQAKLFTSFVDACKK